MGGIARFQPATKQLRLLLSVLRVILSGAKDFPEALTYPIPPEPFRPGFQFRLLLPILLPRMHRDKKRCHEKYDETNAHHPHMHDNHPFFKTTSDYSENGPGITAKKRGPLSPLVRRSQNGIAFAAFPQQPRK